ncbi:terpene synthase [Streptomyces sp. S.PB5]|uniref:terpene synthase family protein n=1 Tax=Streptomyces sp. S.PB5 TaxID=3020844 RepID=UPI0025AFF447|nr:terpene synthase [Streptomyces sp. S.PB5]MDN3020975.1 terpene synthase [Streptomyces sp. S.PB5]
MSAHDPESAPSATPAVPSFYCPIPFAVHPGHEQLTQASIGWLERYELFGSERQYLRLTRSMPGLLAALAHPRGTDEGLRLASDFLMWLYAFDDEYCEEGPLARRPGDLVATLRRLLRAVEVPESDAFDRDRYAAALRDIAVRLAGCASPAQTSRWADALRAYFLDQVWCAQLRVRGVVPSLPDYLLMRLANGSMGVTTALCDVVDGLELSPGEFGSPRVRALREMTCALVGWDNDIISYEKERRRVGDGQNLLDVLARDHRCARPQALATALALRDCVMRRFVGLLEEVKGGAGPQLRAYVDGLASWIRANLEWGQICERYLDVEGTAAELAVPVRDLPRSGLIGVYTATPSPSAPERLHIPAVSWWWDAFEFPEQRSPAH